MAVKLIRGLSLYGSIDRVWQTAVPGFYIGGNERWIGIFCFFMNSALLGVGLAMDAFSVSLANGMNEKR